MLFIFNRIPLAYPSLWCKPEWELYMERQRMAYRRHTCSISI